jgi:hypothetical protein
MLFDFGAARKYSNGSFGADLRQIHRFRNTSILKALTKAAHEYHRCHRVGAATIAYGNTNSVPSRISIADALETGLRQGATIRRLYHYQHAGHHYKHQDAAAAGDIEPGWQRPAVSKALVRGANRSVRYYDFGNAGGCAGQPGSGGCYNDWTLDDLAQVSIGGRSHPLPEIYRRYEANQWSLVQRHWSGEYSFAGVTSEPQSSLSAAQSWLALDARARRVHRELVSIRSSPQLAAVAKRAGGMGAIGGPMTGTTAAHINTDPEGFFSTSVLYPLRNEWLVSSHRRFTAVDAGADPIHPSTGVLAIFRQNYVRVTQTQKVVKVPGAGALKLTGAPLGARPNARSQRAGDLAFTGANGTSGTLHLDDGTVTVP